MLCACLRRIAIGGLLAATLWPLLWSTSVEAGEAEWRVFFALGEAGLEQRNYALAEKNFAAALQEAERFGRSDVRLGLTLNNLAMANNGLGHYDKAEPLLRRALKLWEQAPAGNELHLASALHNLAGVVYAKGDSQAAAPLVKRALAIREKALSADHPAVLRTRKSLATLEKSQGSPVKPVANAPAKAIPRFSLHLASLKSVDGARREWQRLQQTFPELLGPMSLSLESVDLGERGVYQRVLTGRFAERAAAHKACARIKAKEQYCQVVKRRDI